MDTQIPAPTSIVEIAPAMATCNSIQLVFDVEAPTAQDPSVHVAGLAASAFSFTLIDLTHDAETPIQSTCTGEIGDEAGLPGYTGCFAGLMVASSYAIRVSAMVHGETVTSVFFVELPAGCLDAGTDGSGTDATAVETGSDAALDVVDAGNDSVADTRADDSAQDTGSPDVRRFDASADE